MRLGMSGKHQTVLLGMDEFGCVVVFNYVYDCIFVVINIVGCFHPDLNDTAS
jgi:hypothetical protein